MTGLSDPPAAGSADTSRDAYRRLQHENFTALLANARYASLQSASAGVLFALLFGATLPERPAAVWWMCLMAALGARCLGVAIVGRRREMSPIRRSAVLYGGMLLSTTVWGVAPIVCVGTESVAWLVAAVLAVSMLTVGAVSTYQTDPTACAATVLPMTLPWALWILLEPGLNHGLLVAALLLLYAHVSRTVVQAWRQRAQELELGLENRRLIGHLRLEAGNARAELERRVEVERELRIARDRAERLSTLDGLTGVPNRRHFDDRLDREINRAQRSGSPLSLVILDVDHFKAFNDNHGHQAGDHCLIAVARIIESCSRRAGDFVARYGGEEFALILPDTDEAAAHDLAETIRAAIERAALVHQASPTASVITASFGVATFTVGVEDSGIGLVREADLALYTAKRAGRNRVAGADSSAAASDAYIS